MIRHCNPHRHHPIWRHLTQQRVGKEPVFKQGEDSGIPHSKGNLGWGCATAPSPHPFPTNMRAALPGLLAQRTCVHLAGRRLHDSGSPVEIQQNGKANYVARYIDHTGHTSISCYLRSVIQCCFDSEKKKNVSIRQSQRTAAPVSAILPGHEIQMNKGWPLSISPTS